MLINTYSMNYYCIYVSGIFAFSKSSIPYQKECKTHIFTLLFKCKHKSWKIKAYSRSHFQLKNESKYSPIKWTRNSKLTLVKSK